MPLTQRKLIYSAIIATAIVGSLIAGIAIGRAPNLLSAEDDKQDTREAILEKLEDTAQRQAQTQAQASFFDPFMQSGFDGDPFAQLQQMQSRMDQLFGNLGSGSSLFNFGGIGAGGAFVNNPQPQIEVEESKEEYRVIISLAKDSDMELKTDLEDNTLAISAQVRTELRDNSNGRQVSSTSVSQFSRAIPLDSPVDATGMRTEKSDSEVVIRIPKLS